MYTRTLICAQNVVVDIVTFLGGKREELDNRNETHMSAINTAVREFTVSATLFANFIVSSGVRARSEGDTSTQDMPPPHSLHPRGSVCRDHQQNGPSLQRNLHHIS